MTFSHRFCTPRSDSTPCSSSPDRPYTVVRDSPYTPQPSALPGLRSRLDARLCDRTVPRHPRPSSRFRGPVPVSLKDECRVVRWTPSTRRQVPGVRVPLSVSSTSPCRSVTQTQCRLPGLEPLGLESVTPQMFGLVGNRDFVWADRGFFRGRGDGVG